MNGLKDQKGETTWIYAPDNSWI